MSALIPSKATSVAIADAQSQQYLAFMLGGEAYAVQILRIKEIISYGPLTTVPMMPSFVRGVINLRGSVLPVIDLQARFGREPTQVARRTCFVIVEIKSEDENGQISQDIGVMVDAVSEVVDIPDANIEPAPSFGARIRPDFIAGMGKIGAQFIIILELDKVLSVQEMSALGGTEQSTGATGAPAQLEARPAV